MLALAAVVTMSLSSLAPDPGCDAKLDDVNAKVRLLQLHGKPKDAFDALVAFKASCFAELAARRQAWLLSDIALLAHKRGDDKTCIAMLKQAPALESDSVVARAVAFNTGLCGGGCVEGGAGAGAGTAVGACESVERGLVRRRAESGDKSYTAAPCAVGSFAGAVAIQPPSGSGTACIALVPATTEGSKWRCPRLAVIEKNALGQLKRREMGFDGGAITDEKECCNLTELSVKSGTGSTLLRVRGSGRDCVEGAAFADYDEVFRFDGASLVFDHADDVR